MSKKGVLHDIKRGTRESEPYDSSWERDYMLLLDSDRAVKRWERCRSLRIPYMRADGKRGHYRPDFIVEREDGQKELHEVKGGHLLADADTQRKLAAGEEFCRKRGMVFKVIARRH
ncbi:MAG: TnsA endonuclease N-terminal domain-containing protein [Candidatus Eisenbacteria bacterium]